MTTANQKIDKLLDVLAAIPTEVYALHEKWNGGLDWLNSLCAGDRIIVRYHWGLESVSETEFILVEHRAERLWVSLDYGEVYYAEHLCDTENGFYKIEAWEN